MTEADNLTEEILLHRQSLTPEEETLLWEAAGSGDSKARNQLVEIYLPLVAKIARKKVANLKRKGYQGLTPKELWGAGSEGLVSAVCKYGRDEFRLKVRPCINNAMSEEIMDSFIVRIPKHRIPVFKKMKQAIEEFSQIGIRDPSDDMIAEKIGTTPMIVTDLRNNLVSMISLDEEISDGDSSWRRIDDIPDKDATDPHTTMVEQEESGEWADLILCYKKALIELGLKTPRDQRLFQEGSDNVYEMRLLFSRLLTEESTWESLVDLRAREGDPYSDRRRWLREIP